MKYVSLVVFCTTLLGSHFSILTMEREPNDLASTDFFMKKAQEGDLGDSEVRLYVYTLSLKREEYKGMVEKHRRIEKQYAEVLRIQQGEIERLVENRLRHDEGLATMNQEIDSIREQIKTLPGPEKVINVLTDSVVQLELEDEKEAAEKCYGITKELDEHLQGRLELLQKITAQQVRLLRRLGQDLQTTEQTAQQLEVEKQRRAELIENCNKKVMGIDKALMDLFTAYETKITFLADESFIKDVKRSYIQTQQEKASVEEGSGSRYCMIL